MRTCAAAMVLSILVLGPHPRCSTSQVLTIRVCTILVLKWSTSQGTRYSSAYNTDAKGKMHPVPQGLSHH